MFAREQALCLFLPVLGSRALSVLRATTLDKYHLPLVPCAFARTLKPVYVCCVCVRTCIEVCKHIHKRVHTWKPEVFVNPSSSYFVKQSLS